MYTVFRKKEQLSFCIDVISHALPAAVLRPSDKCYSDINFCNVATKYVVLMFTVLCAPEHLRV